MRQKASCVRHPHAADHHMIAVAEGMNVVAASCPDIAERSTKASLFANKIFRCRELHVGRIAFKGRHRQSRPFRKRGVIGKIVAALARRAAMRIENDIVAKRLRRLRDAQPRALRRGLDMSAVADQFYRVGHGNRRHRSAGQARGIDRTRNHRRRDEGPRGVMDQHDVGRLARERFQSGADRSLPGCAASGGRLVAHVADSLVEHRGIVGVEDRLHRKDLWMAAKRLHRPRNHRSAADRAVLLWPSRPGTKPAAGGDNDSGSPFRCRHRDLSGTIREEKPGVSPAAHSPYHAVIVKTERFPNSCAYFVALHLQDRQNCLKCRHET